MSPWERFATVARSGQADRIPVALIVDSPWLPGYECVRSTGGRRLILSTGGGVSPETPPDAIDALVEAAGVA